MDRVKEKKKYIDKYSKIYKQILTNDKIKVLDIIDRLADTCLYLDECNEHLAVEGLVVEMCQGNYSIERENPYSKIHNDKLKLFNSLIKMLNDMMPSEKADAQAKAGEALSAFIKAGK